MFTVSEIADILGVQAWRVHYLLKTRHIEAPRRAGAVRLFNEDIIEILRQELAPSDQITI